MKPFLTALGFFCLGLAILGAILPVMPTTCFVLMAAACFAKSSPRFYNWLLASRIFGPMINQWQTTRSMPKRAKVMAITTILCSGSISIYVLDSVMVQTIVAAILLIPIAIILRVRNSEDLCPVQQSRPS
jgi:hypothetical protein